MRLIISGGVLIALQLASWGGFYGTAGFPIGRLFGLFAILAIPFVLRWSKGRAGGVAAMVGVFLLLNGPPLALGTWVGAAVVMCGVVAIVDGFRTRSRETDLIELRKVVLGLLAMVVTLVLGWYVIPLLYGSK